MKIDIETEKGHLRSGRSTRPSGCMTLQIGWLHGGANWHSLFLSTDATVLYTLGFMSEIPPTEVRLPS
jgi:hypothetical protein